MLTIIDPAINLKQNPPSPLEYPEYDEILDILVGRVGFDLDILVIAQIFEHKPTPTVPYG
jgi:hypothetical protein